MGQEKDKFKKEKVIPDYLEAGIIEARFLSAAQKKKCKQYFKDYE